MAEPWLNVIGIGEDGLSGLSETARSLVRDAEIIIGGDRHLDLSENTQAKRVSWPSPFDAMIDEICSYKGQRIVTLVTGDPLWYSVGARIARSIAPEEIRFFPQLSAFQFAACRMGWSLADVETLTVHGRPVEQTLPWIYPGTRMLLLTKDSTTPASVAQLLCERGYEKSRLFVLGALGGPNETRIEGIADEWQNCSPEGLPDFHTLAIECVAGKDAQILPRTGLPDHAFRHDGKLTKQAVRAITLAKLVPHRGAILWDIGAGCGSVGIEWMRAAPEARAVAIEPRQDRQDMTLHNAKVLGAPALKLIAGNAPDVLAQLPSPDAIFIGGGIGADNLFETCWAALKPGGRLVANVVTLEGEAQVTAFHNAHGGELVRIVASTLTEIGELHGYKPAMQVTQWSLSKPFDEGETK